MIGQTISHYQILSKLGEGGMGVVYKALDTGLDREVAVKFLPTSASRDAEAKERFMREAKSASALDHANICTIFEIGETDDGQLFMAMALYDGESLEDRLSEGPMPEDEAVDIARQVALGLAAAHEAGIVHRDIKPANVIITSKGVAKVLDFGVAKLGGSAALTQTGASVGTMLYMSPEQARGDDVDARADIWSLGGMLYEMISGSSPFSTGYDAAILYAILNEDPIPLKDLMPDVSEVVSDIVAKCLSKDKEQRFATAEDVASALPGEGATVIVERVEVPAKQVNTLVQYGAIAAAGGLLIYGAMYWLGLPDWVFPVGLILLLAGFPLLLLSSIFEKKRSGMKTAERAELSGLQKWLTTRRVARGGMLAMSAFGVVTATYMILRALGVGAFATLLTAGVLESDDVIIISQFENRTDQEGLGKTLTTAFKVDMSQTKALAVMERRTEIELLGLMRRDPDEIVNLDVALEMAERQGAKAVVAGEIGQVGEGYVLSVRLVSTADQETLVQLRESAADDSELLGAVDRLSKGLRKKIGESLRSVRASPPIVAVTTASLDALRAFAKGFDLHVQGKNIEGGEYLQRAVELDTTFAMAWHDWAAASLGAGASFDLIQERFSKAYALRDRLSERERLHVTAAYRVFIDNDPGAAIRALEAVLELYPFDWRALINMGITYSSQRRFAEAEDVFRRAFELSNSNLLYSSLILSLAGQGKWEEGDSLFNEWNAAQNREPVGIIVEAQFEFAKGNLDAALTTAQAIIDSDESSGYEIDALELARKVFVVRGQVSEHRRAMNELISRFMVRNDTASALRQLFEGAADDAIATGNTSFAIERLARARVETPMESLPPEGRPWQSLAFLLIELDDIERADSAAGSPGYNIVTEEIIAPLVRGWITYRQDGPERGIPALIEAYNQMELCVRCLQDYLGLAYDETGAYSEAISAYERFVSAPDLFSFFVAARTGPVHFRLGELYEETDDLDEAIEHYSQFAELWENADPELQPKVTEANRRIESLLDRLAREPAN